MLEPRFTDEQFQALADDQRKLDAVIRVLGIEDSDDDPSEVCEQIMDDNERLRSALKLLWAEVVASDNAKSADFGWPKACAATREALTHPFRYDAVSNRSSDGENARAWHRCVEGLMTMAGLSSALSPSESLLEFQIWLGKPWIEGEPSECDGSAWDRLPPLVKASDWQDILDAWARTLPSESSGCITSWSDKIAELFVSCLREKLSQGNAGIYAVFGKPIAWRRRRKGIIGDDGWIMCPLKPEHDCEFELQPLYAPIQGASR